MAAPVRLQLSRRRGFNLQALSHATNGLPAVNVGRPSRFGNPFRVGGVDVDGTPMSAARVVDRFRAFAEESHEDAANMRAIIRGELCGKNLACWCGIAGPCHADVLLAIANQEGE
jgi:hypothetical protein